MNEKNLELTLRLEWPIENYLHSVNFSLDRKGLYIHKLKRDGVELKQPKNLYKYFPDNDDSLRTIRDGYLYFSSPRNFNDPFDCLTNREKYILKGGEEITKHREDLGVCCFSLVNDNPVMWAHYTNQYQGFCIKLKNEKLLKSKNIGIKTFVSYLKDYNPSNKEFDEIVEKLNGLEVLPNKTKELFHIILRLIENYTWKDIKWGYEEEFRAISWTTENFHRRFKIDKEDLEEVYIGHKMKIKNSNYYDQLISAIRDNYPNCKIFEVKPNPLVVKLEFNEI